MKSLQALVETLLSESVFQDECIVNLIRTPSQDYPTIWDGNEVRGGHRLVWEFHNGFILNGSHVHHSCENKRCLNIEHLEMLSSGEHSRLHRRIYECPKHHIPFYARMKKGDGRCRICEREKAARYRLMYPEKGMENYRRMIATETPEHRTERLRKKNISEKKRQARLKAEREAEKRNGTAGS